MTLSEAYRQAAEIALFGGKWFWGSGSTISQANKLLDEYFGNEFGRYEDRNPSENDLEIDCLGLLLMSEIVK